MFEVPSSHECRIFIGGLTSERHSGKATNLDLRIVWILANTSFRKKDLSGTRRDQGRLSSGRRKHPSLGIWVQNKTSILGGCEIRCYPVLGCAGVLGTKARI